MTTEQRREEIKRKFNEAYNAEIVRLAEFDLGTDSLMDFIFDFFYSEIEAREKEIDALNDDVRGYRNGHELNSKRYIEALSKLQRLEDIIKAQEAILSCVPIDGGLGRHNTYLSGFTEAISHYQHLKEKQNG